MYENLIETSVTLENTFPCVSKLNTASLKNDISNLHYKFGSFQVIIKDSMRFPHRLIFCEKRLHFMLA